MSPYRIVLMETHAMLRQALKKIMEGDGDLEVIGEMGTGDELFDYLERGKPGPDMVILDLFASTLRGVEGLRRLKLLYPKIRVLVMSIHEDEAYLKEVMSSGAEGYLLKKEMNIELFSAIARIREGGRYHPPLLCGKRM